MFVVRFLTSLALLVCTFSSFVDGQFPDLGQSLVFFPRTYIVGEIIARNCVDDVLELTDGRELTLSGRNMSWTPGFAVTRVEFTVDGTMELYYDDESGSKLMDTRGEPAFEKGPFFGELWRTQRLVVFDNSGKVHWELITEYV